MPAATAAEPLQAAARRAPERVQRRRTLGWRMPPGVVYVGRPTLYQNPYGLRGTGCMIVVATIEEAIAAYRTMLEDEIASVGRLPGYLHPLRGASLACWCPLGRPCHADVLLEVVNR